MQTIKTGSWRSLKARVTIFTLVIFVISLWSLVFYAGNLLRENMQRQLGEQQLATVSLVAAQVNQGLDERLRALEAIAATLGPAQLANPAVFQSHLEELAILQGLFNGGTTVLSPQGTVLAEFPRAANRAGLIYQDAEVAHAALKHGQTTLGQPITGPALKAPVLVMAAPIRNAQGAVVAALSGVINLGQPNFLDRITQSRYGNTGGYLVVSPQQRLVLAATDPSRAMATLVQGINPMADRFMQGFEGSGLTVNYRGDTLLVSAKGVPIAGWYVAALLPAAEAFAPINELRQDVLLATVVMTLLVTALTWWVLRRQLSPMLAAIVQRQDSLLASEKRFRDLFEKNSSVMLLTDPVSGTLTDANQAAATYLGYSRAQLIDMPINHINLQPSDRLRQAQQQALHKLNNNFEFPFRLASGETRDVEVFVTPLQSDGPTQLLAIVHDITERKQAQTMLQKLSVAVEQSPASVVITDLDGRIEYVNPRFTQITGFSAAEALGKNPRILRSMKTAPETYEAMWNTLISGQFWQGELLNKRKNGELYWEEIHVAPVLNPGGTLTHYVAVNTDITARKTLEEQVHQLAFHDSLTQLPNRHLLKDRLRQSMAASKRSRLYGALLFLDLDNFKPLNDAQGHDVGDLLLIEVADRLKNSVREIDTVARFGGDEFVLIISELEADAATSLVQVGLIAEKIRMALAEPYLFTLFHEGRADITVEHHCSASIGMTLFLDHEDRLEEVLKWADTAMYQAKADGRNQVRFYAGQAAAAG